MPLPKFDSKIPWRELDRRAGIRGEIDDTGAKERGYEDSGFYSNKEPNINRELRRTKWLLKKLGLA